MKTPLVPIQSMTVAEIMKQPVRTVRPDSSVAELVRLLTSEHISGAPVLDEAGAIVGVVSVTDVIRLLCDGEESPCGDPLLSAPSAAPGADAQPDPQEVLESFFLAPGDRLPAMDRDAPPHSLLAETAVADIMTPAAFAVPSTASLGELAEFLIRGGIHRSLVVDDGVLSGIVTTVDIVQAIAADPHGDEARLRRVE